MISNDSGQPRLHTTIEDKRAAGAGLERRPRGGILFNHDTNALHAGGQAKPRQFYIHGVNTEGRIFRPSDWSERLAGAMSSFRPGGGRGGIGSYIGYSPYCVPRVINGIKCVIN